jgi:hypothetical protein
MNGHQPPNPDRRAVIDRDFVGNEWNLNQAKPRVSAKPAATLHVDNTLGIFRRLDIHEKVRGPHRLLQRLIRVLQDTLPSVLLSNVFPLTDWTRIGATSASFSTIRG